MVGQAHNIVTLNVYSSQISMKSTVLTIKPRPKIRQGNFVQPKHIMKL